MSTGTGSIKTTRQASVVLVQPTLLGATDELQWCIRAVNGTARVRLARRSFLLGSVHRFLVNAVTRRAYRDAPHNTLVVDDVYETECNKDIKHNYLVDYSALSEIRQLKTRRGSASLLGLAWYNAPNGVLHLRICGRRIAPHNKADDATVLGIAGACSWTLHPFFVVYPDLLYALQWALNRAQGYPRHCEGQLRVLTGENPVDEASWATAIDQTLDLDTSDATLAAAQLRTSWDVVKSMYTVTPTHPNQLLARFVYTPEEERRDEHVVPA